VFVKERTPSRRRCERSAVAEAMCNESKLDVNGICSLNSEVIPSVSMYFFEVAIESTEADGQREGEGVGCRV
jgi:hypothetical protein